MCANRGPYVAAPKGRKEGRKESNSFLPQMLGRQCALINTSRQSVMKTHTLESNTWRYSVQVLAQNRSQHRTQTGFSSCLTYFFPLRSSRQYLQFILSVMTAAAGQQTPEKRTGVHIYIYIELLLCL